MSRLASGQNGIGSEYAENQLHDPSYVLRYHRPAGDKRARWHVRSRDANKIVSYVSSL